MVEIQNWLTDCEKKAWPGDCNNNNNLSMSTKKTKTTNVYQNKNSQSHSSSRSQSRWIQSRLQLWLRHNLRLRFRFRLRLCLGGRAAKIEAKAETETIETVTTFFKFINCQVAEWIRGIVGPKPICRLILWATHRFNIMRWMRFSMAEKGVTHIRCFLALNYSF